MLNTVYAESLNGNLDNSANHHLRPGTDHQVHINPLCHAPGQWSSAAGSGYDRYLRPKGRGTKASGGVRHGDA